MSKYLEYYDIESDDEVMKGGNKIDKGGYGCIYYPSINCKTGKENSSKKYISKLQKENVNTINEYNIGKEINKINNYNNYFVPVIQKCKISSKKLINNNIEKCELIENQEKIVMMKSKYIEGETLISYMRNKEINSIEKMKNYVNYLTHLVEGLILLEKKNIVHRDIKGNNILINKKTNQPLLIDFGFSFNSSKITKEELRNILIYSTDYILWSPEQVILSYVLKNNEILTKNTIEKISNEIFNSLNNKILKYLFSGKIIEIYKKSLLIELLNYENKKEDEIYKEVMKGSNKFDIYSLGILWLGLLKHIFKDENHEFIIYLKKLFLLCIHPVLEKRLSPYEVKENIDSYFYENKEKNFNELKKHLI